MSFWNSGQIIGKGLSCESQQLTGALKVNTLSISHKHIKNGKQYGKTTHNEDAVGVKTKTVTRVERKGTLLESVELKIQRKLNGKRE